MEFLLDIVKEQGIANIIFDYVDNMERGELKNKISDICQEINKLNLLSNHTINGK